MAHNVELELGEIASGASASATGDYQVQYRNRLPGPAVAVRRNRHQDMTDSAPRDTRGHVASMCYRSRVLSTLACS
jgi:hypothetical protein